MRLMITAVAALAAMAPAASAASFSAPLELTGATGGEPSIITTPLGDVRGSGRAAYGVLKVRHGRVQEVGIVASSVTRGPAAQRRPFGSMNAV